MKINCYIVQDLLPLYVENLANERTLSDVKEHLVECEECRQFLEDMSKKQLDNLQEESVNVNELDYLKKIHSNITKRSIISAVLFSFLLLFSITQFLWGSFYAHEIKLLLPLVIGLGYITLFDGMKKEKKIGFDFWVANVIVVVITACTIILFMMIGIWIKEWQFPFGLQVNQVGPFINNILWIARILVAGGVIYGIIKAFHKSILYFILISNSISSICMISSYIHMFRRLDSVVVYEAGRNSSIILYIEGVIITGIIWIWLKRQHSYGAN